MTARKIWDLPLLYSPLDVMCSVYHTEYTELQPLLSGVHSVMRVKFAVSGEGGVGWGVHAHPLLLHLPSLVKLQCTLQLSGQTH
jgi:hypothetical protein